MREKMSIIDTSAASELSVRKQCEILEINRSTLYLKSLGESDLNHDLMQLIDKEHIEFPTKGVLSMTSFLNGEGYTVNSKRIRRLMRLMSINTIYARKNLTKLGKAEYIHPYLLRNLKAERPNQVWAIDISYIPMKKGFMYLTAIIDVYSRYILGWSLCNTLEAETQTRLVTECIEQYGKPEIINSDQGSQYTSKVWVDCINYHEVKISMDGKGRATDNAFIERFFRTIKEEYIYIHPSENILELNKGISTYIHYYNNKRYHQGIENKKPIELYNKQISIERKKITNIAKELVY